MLGRRVSVKELSALCQTNKNGTTTNKMIHAIKRLGLPALVVEKTTLRHLLSSLRASPNQKRAVLVSYLYADDDNDRPDYDSGHWAVVSSFKRSHGRIVLLDSYTGRKTSYNWLEFRRRWVDENMRRRWLSRTKYRLIRKREKQLMIVVSRKIDHLPRFAIPTARIIN